jgi:hypothetical protein
MGKVQIRHGDVRQEIFIQHSGGFCWSLHPESVAQGKAEEK